MNNRYEKQLKEFKAKGYYLLEDGTKSTALQIGKKRKSSKSPKKGVKRVGVEAKRGRNSKSNAKGGKKSGGKAAKEADVSKESEDLDIQGEEDSVSGESSA